jgi:NADH:ubiquinone oxidoreductase subunit 5 (subunit L)/multisubunit Na+/H+ antiporter MnhA subunit
LITWRYGSTDTGLSTYPLLHVSHSGSFLIIRFSILFEFTLFTNYYLILLGALTLSFGSVTAVFQNDIKKLVAYSTISQIGYLVCGCGFCCYEEVLLYLIIHALNKAFLFVLVGYTVHFFNANTDMRQMGSCYLYSLDITVLLSGVCFNLAGLPYSAGFLGKEFLLFQVLRDDFISLFVRGCWLVSFFFTPIYMFILVFVVSFGPKKSTLTVYSDTWYYNFYETTQIFIKKIRNKSFGVNLTKKLLFRFQYTMVTSRVTIYLLFFFWCSFFFLGEFLLLLLFNFNNLQDSISSNFFLLFKSHTIFLTDNMNFYLNEVIFFYILFFTTCAFMFLLNLRFTSNERFFKNLFILDFTLILLLVKFLNPTVSVVFFSLLYVNHFWLVKKN